MPLNDDGKDDAIDGVTGGVAFLSLHEDTDLSGGSEISGGGYARQAIIWNASTGGVATNNGDITFDVPGGSPQVVATVGLWTLITGGDFKGWLPLNGSIVGKATVTVADTITSYGHGLSDDDRVIFMSSFSESLPTGLTEDTMYYVVNGTTDTFEVSLTSGGAAVDITSTGELAFQLIVPESFNAAGQILIADGTLSISGQVV